MTLDELKARLNQLEWRDVEFKESTFDIPKNAYPTVSAFSNTEGGWIVFGIQAKDGQFTIKGVVNADELQNGFIGTLRQKGKFSCAIAFKETQLHDGNDTVLVFYIPEVHRSDKPVYLDGRIDESYVRKGGTNQRCNRDEIEAFLRDAATERFEDHVVDTLEADSCFDGESLKWYRRFFHERQAGHETESKSDIAFLEHFGLVLPVGGTLRPTRAAILLFGSNAAMHRVLPRQVVDFFIFQCKSVDKLPEQRWDDRIESLAEGNILKAWQRIVEVYRTRFAEGGFDLDATTLQRKGTPPDYLAFREAVLNLLIHQDYGDHTRKANITIFVDEAVFWNPGSSFIGGEEFFKPGDKPVRNTRLRAMLTRIGIGEQANTGIRSIYAHQREMGRVSPKIINDPVNHAFAVTLSKQTIASERQRLVKVKMGVQLSDEQAAVFIHCWNRGEIRPLEAQSVCGQSLAETHTILKFLCVQSLLEQRTDAGGDVFQVAVHLREIYSGSGPVAQAKPSLITEQAHPPTAGLFTEQADVLKQMTEKHWQVLAFCDLPKTIAEIRSRIEIASRQHVKYRYIDVLLRGGLIKMTLPQHPTSPKQAYVVTSAGLELIKNKVANNPVADQASPPHNQLGQSASDQASGQKANGKT